MTIIWTLEGLNEIVYNSGILDELTPATGISTTRYTLILFSPDPPKGYVLGEL